MPAKKATKTAAKKAAKKKEAAPEETSSAIFNILDTPVGFSQSVGDSMKSELEKRKGREVSFSTQSDLQVSTLPLRPISFQWMINNRGLRKGITNILARDMLGKSSFVYNLFAGFMQAGHPCCFIPCEGKPLDTAWAMRCMSSDRALAQRMVERVHVINSHLLVEMDENVESWCRTLRDPKGGSYVPMSVALIVAPDPIGRLATNAQAAGISSYDGKNKQKQIEIGDKGHSWDRARWLHDWVDKLNLMRDTYNLHIIPVEHQNDKDVAGGGAAGPMASFMPAWKKDLDNRTKRGGNALNQVTSLQLTMAEKGSFYSAGTRIARRIIMTPYKNSYGPQVRTCCYALKLEPGAEGEDEGNGGNYLDPGLRWDYPEVEWLAESGLLGFRKTGDSLPKERFSSDALHFTQLSLVDAAQAWREADPSFTEELGAKLKIPGYLGVREKVMSELGAE